MGRHVRGLNSSSATGFRVMRQSHLAHLSLAGRCTEMDTVESTSGYRDVRKINMATASPETVPLAFVRVSAQMSVHEERVLNYEVYPAERHAGRNSSYCRPLFPPISLSRTMASLSLSKTARPPGYQMVTMVCVLGVWSTRLRPNLRSCFLSVGCPLLPSPR